MEKYCMRSKSLLSLAVTLITLLAVPQFASAQRRLTPLPHPVGYPQRPPNSPDRKKNPASPWTPLTNQPNLFDGSANPILLMDGSVLIQDAGFPDWIKLTPDQNGSYINGTWSSIASMPNGYGPFYHS